MRPLIVNELELRLARTEREIDACQELRYRIFYEEMGAKASILHTVCRRDIDVYDEFCDHLMVLDTSRGDMSNPCVVGTYRLLRGDVAQKSVGFYSANVFDLSHLMAHSSDLLELGRSCIDGQYRSRGTIQFLWRGLAQYIFENRIRYMFGCASIHGTDPADVKLPLAYLYHHHLAPRDIRVYAKENAFVDMNTMAKDAIDARQAFRQLPPLIKGYLRLGCAVGDGAVIDKQFNTIITNIVADTQNITRKYLDHYTQETEPLGAIGRVNAGVRVTDSLVPCA